MLIRTEDYILEYQQNSFICVSFEYAERLNQSEVYSEFLSACFPSDRRPALSDTTLWMLKRVPPYPPCFIIQHSVEDSMCIFVYEYVCVT